MAAWAVAIVADSVRVGVETAVANASKGCFRIVHLLGLENFREAQVGVDAGRIVVLCMRLGLTSWMRGATGFVTRTRCRRCRPLAGVSGGSFSRTCA